LNGRYWFFNKLSTRISGGKAASLVPYFDATIVEEHEHEQHEDAESGQASDQSQTQTVVVTRQRLVSGTDGHITEDEDDRFRRLETEISYEDEELELSKKLGVVEEERKSPGTGGSSPMDVDVAATTSAESVGAESEDGTASPPPPKVSRFEGLVLPDEPSKECPKELEQYFGELFKKKRRGIDPNKSIVQRKDFRNPSLYEKLVQFCELDEFGSNFPPVRIGFDESSRSQHLWMRFLHCL
jgi:hypothetical protein